jgi:hypothetical protein
MRSPAGNAHLTLFWPGTVHRPRGATVASECYSGEPESAQTAIASYSRPQNPAWASHTHSVGRTQGQRGKLSCGDEEALRSDFRISRDACCVITRRTRSQSRQGVRHSHGTWSRKFRQEIAVLNEEHTREAIARRLEEGPARSDLRDFIYGAIDGAVRILDPSGARTADVRAFECVNRSRRLQWWPEWRAQTCPLASLSALALLTCSAMDSAWLFQTTPASAPSSSRLTRCEGGRCGRSVQTPFQARFMTIRISE